MKPRTRVAERVLVARAAVRNVDTDIGHAVNQTGAGWSIATSRARTCVATPHAAVMR
jgi:hypothetical protein